MLTTCHSEIHVGSLAAARSFYVDLLGLEILQELPEIRLLASGNCLEIAQYLRDPLAATT